MQPFDYTDYREYLKSALPTSGQGRGARTKLAEALGCQAGFVSLVLTGGSDFSLEHGPLISRFLGHTDEEEDFFLLLLHFARAGSEQLRKYYSKKIQTIQTKRREIHERIQVKSNFSLTDQMIYYSSWHYLAVHMCVYSATLRTKPALSKRLGIPVETVEEVVTFLVQSGLVTDEDGKLTATPSRTHLPANSPLVNIHHTNWRMKAIQSLGKRNPTNLHYSAVFSLSESAAEKLRELLLESVSKFEPVIREAADETVYVVSADLFRL